MITIAGRDVSKYLTNVSRKIVRTYKGEIERNQVGQVLKFPASFMTLGFDLEWIGLRSELDIIYQLLMASDTFVFVIDEVRGNNYKGTFSATTCQMSDLSDKNEKHATLSVSIVNTTNDITTSEGSDFSVKTGGTSIASGKFGEEVTIPDQFLTFKILNSETFQTGGTLPSKVVLIGDIKILQP